MGVVSFSTQAQTEIRFTSKQTVDAIKPSVLNITYQSGATRTHLGLNKVHIDLFSAQGGMRTNVPHILLVITDGQSNSGEKINKQENYVIRFATNDGQSKNVSPIKRLESRGPT